MRYKLYILDDHEHFDAVSFLVDTFTRKVAGIAHSTGQRDDEYELDVMNRHKKALIYQPAREYSSQLEKARFVGEFD